MDNGLPIRSVIRSIAVLKAINRHGSLCMASIARESGLSYPTTCRVVRTLIHEGLIEQEPSRKHYRPTALVQELSVGYRPHNGLVNAARPHLVELTKAVGWPVSITGRVGMSMVLRDSTHAQTTLTFEHYPPGFTFPLLESASGSVALAFASDEEIAEIRRWVRHDDMMRCPDAESLARVREQGYAAKAWSRHNLNPGRTSAISVPIVREGAFEAALTLIYFVASMTQSEAIERYLPTLRRVAGTIGDALEDAHRPEVAPRIGKRRPAVPMSAAV